MSTVIAMKIIINGKDREMPCVRHSKKVTRMYRMARGFSEKLLRFLGTIKQWSVLLLIIGIIPITQAYQPAIEFQETFNNIVTVQQVSGWASGSARTFSRLAMSGDGSRVAFLVSLNYCGSEPVCQRLYVVNADGSGLIDFTPSSDIKGITYLRMNYDGSRLFYRSPIFGSHTNIYYCEVDSKSCGVAVTDGIWQFDFRVPYSIDNKGEFLYFQHDDGWDDVSKTYERGLYTAAVGGGKTMVMHINELPCTSECGSINMLRFLGASASGNELSFTFNQRGLDGNVTGMWVHGSSGPELVGSNHSYVWGEQDIFGHMLSDDGNTALYSYQQDLYSAKMLSIIDMGTKEVIPLASSENSGDVAKMAALSPDGRYVRYQGHGYLTRVDLANNSKRDLLSYSTQMRKSLWSGGVSNFSENNQRYFMLNLNEASGAKLVRVDLDSAVEGDAPVITNINFTASALLHADDSTIGISLNVNDPQGLSDIESVRIDTLVEGREVTDFNMDRKPLLPDRTLLYDDGSHGDAVAGDGIFSFDAIATRKGDYSGSNTFYARFNLPHAVGIRVVAKDKSQNYAIVDVPLVITDNPVSDYAAVVQENTDIKLQPIDVYGQAYNLTLNRYNNLQDSNGYYWRLGSYAVVDYFLPKGAWVDVGINIKMEPVDVFGTLLDVTLIPWQNQQDPLSLYWTVGEVYLHSE